MSLNRRGLLFNGKGGGARPSGSFDLQELPIVVSCYGLASPITLQVLQPETGIWFDLMTGGSPLQLNSDNTFLLLQTQGIYRLKPFEAKGDAVVWFHEESTVPEWNW